jgi:hypothetical protein
VKNKFKESKKFIFFFKHIYDEKKTLNLKKKTRIFDFFKMKYEVNHISSFFLQPFESLDDLEWSAES